MNRRYKMDGYGIWCDICPWRHTLKPSKWVNRQRHPFSPTSLHAVFLAPNKVKNISNDGNYFINKVMLKCWTKLEYFFISYKKWATELYIIDRKYFKNLHNSTQRRHTLAIQSTDVRVLQTILHYEIIIQDVWTSCIPLFSAEINA